MSTAATKLTQAESAEREKTIAREMRGLPVKAVIGAIAADRIERWRPLVAAMKVPEQLAEWARQMTDLQGPRVMVFAQTLDWLTALLVARYGEAEYNWPAAFSADDVRRAWRWLGGDKPEGVTYIVSEG